MYAASLHVANQFSCNCSCNYLAILSYICYVVFLHVYEPDLCAGDYQLAT